MWKSTTRARGKLWVSGIFWNFHMMWVKHGKTIINHPIFHGLYNPFIVILGMVYYCFTTWNRIYVANKHIQIHSLCVCMYVYIYIYTWISAMVKTYVVYGRPNVGFIRCICARGSAACKAYTSVCVLVTSKTNTNTGFRTHHVVNPVSILHVVHFAILEISKQQKTCKNIKTAGFW